VRATGSLARDRSTCWDELAVRREAVFFSGTPLLMGRRRSRQVSGSKPIGFAISPARKQRLPGGVDDIGLIHSAPYASLLMKRVAASGSRCGSAKTINPRRQPCV